MRGKTAIVTSLCLLLASIGVMLTTFQSSGAQQKAYPPPPAAPQIGRYQLIKLDTFPGGNGSKYTTLALLDTATGQVWMKTTLTESDAGRADKWSTTIEPLAK
jgi:hypothetical protein